MLEGLTPNKYSPVCKVREIADTLEESDRKILMDAVNDSDKWGAIALRNALNKRGLQMSDKPIVRHREGRCDC